jgi:hypothetical protein
MAEKKTQHFVPKFYLRRFGTDAQISLYNIRRKQFVDGASIRGQCQRNYFYGEDLELENWFGALEGEASETIRALVGGVASPADPAVRDVLAAFVATLYFRTPAATEQLDSIATAAMRVLVESEPSVPAELAASVHEYRVRARDRAAAASQAGVMAPLLLDLELTVLTNRSSRELITSDSPVVLHNQWSAGEERSVGVGFASRGLQVFLPLDPRHALLFYDADVYSIRNDKRTTRALSQTSTADALNALQVLVVSENLYYSGLEAMRAPIERLPWSAHIPRLDSTRTTFATGVNNPNSELIHFHLPVRQVRGLRFPFCRVRREFQRVPMAQRRFERRPGAMAIYEDLNGP